jgi:hypothetical protein
MFNRRILIEHFDGRRRLDDPELQRQFELLREQATIDWARTYAGKGYPVTVDDLVEDYLENARWAARTQRKLRLAALIVVVTILAITVAALIIQP